MNKSLLFLIGIFLWVSTSNTLAQQPLYQQKSLKLAPKTTVTGKIDNFLSVLQGAKSLKEVQTAFIQASFSQAEVKQLEGRIEASPSLKQKLDGLYNQVNQAAKIKSAEKTREEARQVTMAREQLNQKPIMAHQQSINKIRQSTAAILDPEVRCQADAPTISEVSGVMPGEEFAVQGKGFGKDPGTVDVMTGGFVYPARVNRWNSCTVYAQLSANIYGVRQDNQAAVSLKTSAGKEVRYHTRFTPLTEIRVYTDSGGLNGAFWGASKDFYFWRDSVLKNDWYVLVTALVRYGDEGHSEIIFSPPINTPNCPTRTKVHAGVAALAGVGFAVVQRIAGPMGTPPY